MKIAAIPYKTLSVILLSIFLLALKVYNPAPIEILQLKTFDWLITSLKGGSSEEIVIVEFGEKSAEKFGQWPFDRRDIAGVIKTLRENDAGTIVIPILFSEADRAGGDASLTSIIKDNDIVIAQAVTNQNSKPDSVRRGFASIGPTNPIDYTFTWPGGLKPIPDLAGAAAGVGVISSSPEKDGVLRRLPLLVGIAGSLYPSIVLETIRVAANDPSYQIKTSESGIDFVRVPAFSPIATDEHARVWLTWNNDFTRMDATKIDARVKGKIVILGLAIEGVGGIVATPVGSKWAHEVPAQALQGVINDTSIKRYSYSIAVEIGFLIVLLGLMIYLVPRASIIWTVPIYVGFVILVSYSCYYLFQQYYQLWDPSYILLAGTFVYGHLIFNNFIREFMLKQQIKKQFGSYLSPAMVEKLQKNPDLLILGGETRDLSIMFTDVRGFTTISEHYGSDVQGLTQIMNRYMTAMTAKIIENDGTLDKYIGDAQMAFWNAPLDDTNHAINAVKTAVQMLDNLAAFNSEIEAEGIPAFGMGIGVNTGNVVVGNMGSAQRFDYTCLGDSVNLASRLEGQSKSYGVKIILGPVTAELVKNSFHVVELDCIQVKGKTEGVRIYSIISPGNMKASSFATHKQFLNLYRAGSWDEALTYIGALRNAFGGELSEYYTIMEDRIMTYRENKSLVWTGIYKAETK